MVKAAAHREDTLEGEALRIYLWRRGEFERLGCSKLDAERLAVNAEVDLRYFEQLRSSGCPVSLAVNLAT